MVSARRLIKRLNFILGILIGLWIGLLASTVQAAIVQSSTTGTFGGYPLDLSQATVTLNVIGGGAAVTNVQAEINPPSAAVSAASQYRFDLLPTMAIADSGFNRITLNVPAGFTAPTLTSVTVAATTLSAACPATTASQYCAALTGTQLQIDLGSKISIDQTPISITFNTTNAATPGVHSFTASIDDSTTPAAAQAVVVGNANGDASDNNSLNINLQGQAATTVLAEISPNVVAANGQARIFSYDMLATIGANDTGIDHLILTAPAGYSGLTLNGLAVAGELWSAVCPATATKQFCASSDGSRISIDLGNKIIIDQTHIRAEVQVNAPATLGPGLFTSQVDDRSTTSVAAMQSINGNADADVTDNNSRQVTVVANADPTLSTVVVEPDIVIANDANFSSITVTLLDANGQPVPTKQVTLATDRGLFDNIDQPTGLTQANGLASGKVRSLRPGVATVTATNVSDGFDLIARPQIYFTQGEVLRLTKRANKEKVMVGDVVTYLIEVKNTADRMIEQVTLLDRLPANFKYMAGSARFNGAPMVDPIGVRQLGFTIGNVAALQDQNGNGVADTGEAGYLTLSYQLIVGSGAKPGDYLNTAHAIDVCDRCLISNRVDAKVEVVIDPLFDLGTIIGKVFDDRDGDGQQSEGEAGIGGAMVVLDNGSYVLTDEYGRYHFPAVTSGHRLLKINLRHLADNALATTDEALVVSVTPGLLVKANFGVRYQVESETIGRPALKGIALESESTQKPIQVQGNVEVMLAVINGAINTLSNAEVQLGKNVLEERVEIRGGQLSKPAFFRPQVEVNDNVHSWRMVIETPEGAAVRTLQGEGAVPALLEWDGRDDAGQLLKGGKIFQYQLLIDYIDGSRVKTARQLFGVNRAEVLSVNMSGGAFKSGSFELADGAKQILAESATVLKAFPLEQVVVEGHSDSLGDDAINLQLSQRRAEEAARFLIEEQGVPRDQLIVRWYGESRPMVGNDTELGREINRRVEVKGDFSAEAEAKLYDQYRAESQVMINGELLPLDGRGGFQRSYPATEVQQLDLNMRNSRGNELHAILPLPRLELNSLQGAQQFSYPSRGDGFEVYAAAGGAWQMGDEVMRYELRGHTDPGNRVEIDGAVVAVAEDGSFIQPLSLHLGKNNIAVIATNPQGYSRIADVRAELSDRDADGKLLLLVAPIPELTVKLPQVGAARTIPELPVSGVTAPANRITINGERIEVDPKGHFTANLMLPKGSSQVRVEVTDPQGFSGVIERNIEVSDKRLFFMAFADGKFGQLTGNGYLEGAGMQESKEFYNEGRLAYYLKGVIKGKYLITSAFDSGTGAINELFAGIHSNDSSKLITNLDPDKIYPVYGDSSTLVNEINSQGKFYLALESDEAKAVVGNYVVGFNDTELASYQRTLYGVRTHYKSLTSRMSGRADTQVVVFGAEIKQTPVHDELRATGGSLYYLSHGDIIEGSEQVSIVVRDKDTGLTLSRTTLQQNIDYRIYYDQGRLITTDPVSSVVEGHSLFDSALLSGHQVTVVVDYETALSSFEKKAYGARMSKTVTENIAVGVTQINDELDQGDYQLTGVDAEMRLGRTVRVVTELAESSGMASHTYYSEDGGLSFNDLTPVGTLNGQAWKAAMELDAGELFGDPGRLFVDVYLKRLSDGFISSGNFLEKGTRKAGINMRYTLSHQSKLLASNTIEESSVNALNPQAITATEKLSLQWRYDANRWGVTSEYQSRSSTNALGVAVDSGDYLSGQMRYQVTDRLAARLERQQTLSGEENDQTTVGADYQLSQSTKLIGRVVEGTQGQAAKAGIHWLFDGGRLYLDERMQQDSLGQSSMSTVVGGESRISANTRVYSEYQIENADIGDKQVSMFGADRFWELQPGLRFKLTGEHSVLNGVVADSERNILATHLSYKGLSGLSWSTKNEVRREHGAMERLQYVSNSLLELKLNPDYTLLLKYLLSQTKDLNLGAIEAELNEHSIGLAYRPVASDRFNLLARYSGIANQRPLQLRELDNQETQTDVFSVEWSYDISHQLEWVDKLAYKRKTEASSGRPALTSNTWLSIHRLNYHFIKDWDVGAEYRSLVQRQANDQRNGWLTELMWRANHNVRLGVGFNFTDFSDNEFSENDYSVYGWFLRLQGKY